jgi:hypothetical protein
MTKSLPHYPLEIRYRNLGQKQSFQVMAFVCDPISDEVYFTTGPHQDYDQAGRECHEWLSARRLKELMDQAFA